MANIRRGFRAYSGSRAPKPPFVLNKDSPLADRIIGWWPGTKDNKLREMAFNNRHEGTLVGNAKMVVNEQGKYGLDLDGSGDYVTFTVGTPYNFERTDPFTVAWDGQLRDLVSAQVVASNMQSSGFRGWEVGYYDDTAKDSDAILFHLFNTWTSNGIRGWYGQNQIGTTRHRIVFTYDGSSTIAGCKVYIDGLEVSGVDQHDTLSATMQTSQNLVIGARSYNKSLQANLKINDILIAGRAWTAAEAFHYWNPSTRWDLYYPVGRRKVFLSNVAASAWPRNPFGHPFRGAIGGPMV